MEEEKIRIIAYEEEPSEEVPVVRRIKKEQSVAVEVVQENLNQFLGTLDKLMKGTRKEIGDFKVDRLEIFVEIDTTGKIGFLGTGIQAGVAGGIKIVLNRKR